jgi:large subunit ribosomal protein L17
MHKVSGYKLKRNIASRRNALLRGLVTSVIENERVITTVPKAKAAKPLVDQHDHSGEKRYICTPAVRPRSF